MLVESDSFSQLFSFNIELLFSFFTDTTRLPTKGFAVVSLMPSQHARLISDVAHELSSPCQCGLGAKRHI